MRALGDRCRFAKPNRFLEAYARVRGAAQAGTTIYLGNAGLYEHKPACLWNDAYTNRLVGAEDFTEQEFLEAAAGDDVILFLPRRSRLYRWYRRHASLFDPLYQSESLAVVVLASRGGAGKSVPAAPGSAPPR